MNDSLLSFTFTCLASFFTLTNPLGTMPVFLSMTRQLDDTQRNRIVRRATVMAFFILLAFTVCGQVLFSIFGLSAAGFRIAAGIIILRIGYDMLQAKYQHNAYTKEEAASYAEDITITPLAIPLLCGPGAIAQGIVLMEQANTTAMVGILLGSIAFIYALCYIILRSSSRLLNFLGDSGTNVMMRIMGLILMVIGVECFVQGAAPILGNIIDPLRNIPV